RPGQHLLKIRRTAVDSNFGIGKAVARARAAALPRLPLFHSRTLAISDAQFGHERKCHSPKPGRTDESRNHVRGDDAPDPRGKRLPRDRAGERTEQPVRVVKEEAADWPALRVIGVEKADIGGATRDERHLPAQVPGVLNPGVHTLRSDGAVDMCGIAGEEHISLAITLDLPVVKMKAREPGGIAEPNRSDRRW